MPEKTSLTLEEFVELTRRNITKFEEVHQESDILLHESDWFEAFLIFISSGSR